MRYTMSAQDQRQALGGDGGMGTTTRGGGGGPTVLDALLYGAAGVNPFAQTGGGPIGGGPTRLRPQPKRRKTGLPTEPRSAMPTIPGGGITPPGAQGTPGTGMTNWMPPAGPPTTGLPTVFNPGMLNPSTLGRNTTIPGTPPGGGTTGTPGGGVTTSPGGGIGIPGGETAIPPGPGMVGGSPGAGGQLQRRRKPTQAGPGYGTNMPTI